MAIITVNSDLDNTNAGDGVTTLREAIAQASNGDTIVFSAPPFGSGGPTTITLQSGLYIDKSITIIGDGYHNLYTPGGDGQPDVYITAGAPGEPGEGGFQGNFNMLLVAVGAT